MGAWEQTGERLVAAESRERNARPVFRYVVAASLTLPIAVSLFAVWLPWYRMTYFSHDYAGVPRSDLLYFGVANWRTALPVISALALVAIAAYAVVGRGRLLLPLTAGLMSSHAVLVALAARDVPVGKFISGFHFVGDYGATVALAASMAAAIPSAFLSGLVRAFLKDQ